MSETIEQRLAIRGHFQEGWRAGENQLAEVTNPDQHHELELRAATQLIDSQGLDHAFFQGQWYVVALRPLCEVRRELGRSLTK